MAYERSEQSFFIGGRSPTFWTNFFLFLITIGVIVIILLMLFCPRWGCWRGTKVIGTDGRTYDGGGNVIINSACCDGGTPRTPGCPQCTPCDGTCEENCRQYANYPDRYKICLSECNPPQTCEERCKQTATSTTEYDYCARQCNPPQTCEETCAQKYSAYPDRYKTCLNECNPPVTCQDRCKQSPTTTYEACMRECYPTCGEYCRETFANDKTAMTSCFNECAPTTTVMQPETTPPDCRDTDGKNINNAGEVHLGDQVYRDSCYDDTHVIEWLCRDGKPSELRLTCPGRCLNGACVATQTTTTPQTYVVTAYS